MERDLNKAFLTVIGAAIVADILTHGQVAIALGNIIRDIVLGAFRVSAGQKV